MIVGTAGHIDHGKTSLVKALTGIDADRLKEEKQRGITIDLGFAYVPLDGGGALGFVDVPGHERLIHTMIAGAASIDLAMLVIAADDGVMPQTHEHLHILELLGLARGLVVITKIDAVDAGRRGFVEREIRALLAGSPFAGAEVFAVSSRTGEGVEGLRARLLAEATGQAAPTPQRALRFAVDRSFVLHGVGVVVTGSVVSGQIALEDAVRILPSGLSARVRSLHTNGAAATRGVMGERCALNLAGSGVRKDAIARGDWLVDPAQDGQTARVDVELHLLPSETASLRSGTLAHVHHGAADLTGRVILLDGPAVAPGAAALGQLVLDRAVPARHGDRLVLRDIRASRTIAGGLVIDSSPPVRRRSAPERLARLDAGRVGDPTSSLRRLLALPPGIVDVAAFAADWGLKEAELDAIAGAVGLQRLSDRRYGLSVEAEQVLTDEVEGRLAAFHRANPALGGMPASGLRLACAAPPMMAPFRALIDHLARKHRIRTEGQSVRLPEHVPELGPEQARLWGRLSDLLDEAGFKPPRVRESAAQLGQTEMAMRRSCKALTRSGRLVEIAPDHFFLTETVGHMAEIAGALSAETQGAFTAAQFRDRIGTGRGLAIQVLEYFDRRGLTQRRGDLRRIVRDPATLYGSRTG